ncbi:vacuolar transporter chaperone 4 [Aspergillus lucknowensis]|uniref:DNA helicase n=1 Tax=Aspergillus lucknowensis TaxID=176173 RepID=A0ABR4M7H2_9EURO
MSTPHSHHKMSSPASSRRRGRPARDSATASPARSVRSQQQPQTSSPAQTTPRASRRLRGEGAVPSSSPMFFQSSPVRENNSSADTPDARMEEPSSPIRASSGIYEGETTPRANGNAVRDSSPIRYVSSSSPTRSFGHQTGHSDIPSSSSGLFVSSRQGLDGHRVVSRRSDLHSGGFGQTPSRRRRVFVDANGVPVADGDPQSDATFSNIHPDTSEAEAMGGNSTRTVWGTNISIQDSMVAFKNFLYNFTTKYRLWADGATEDETRRMGEAAEEREYVNMLHTMRQLGVTSLNLDAKNLKAYPPTLKLWHQLHGYPQEIIPLMDQSVRDVMVELAAKEMERLRSQIQRNQNNHRDLSSASVVPSSDVLSDSGRIPQTEIPDLVAEAETKPYKILPFGLDSTVNMRDLDPADMDKLVSIKGLVIRATPIIPDMKEAFFRCQACNHSVQVDIDRGKIAEPTICPRQVCQERNSMQIVHNRCVFADKQVIKLQETPDSIPDGQTPHSVSLCVYDELVDVCKAGDRVEVTGIFRSNPVRINPRQRTQKSLFKTYIDVLHVQKIDRKKLGIDVSTVEQELSEQAAGDAEQTRKITAEEEEKIRRTSTRPDLYELLARSLAPSVYEMDDVKKGILLQLFGGTNKSFQKGGNPRYRGDINVLLCGDPSTSKSQLLRYVHKIAPRGVYTSGKGSSAVGLTAYVTRDPETRQMVLESGALVLSDGGVCCIDEFDKMNESTRSVLHEVMEQQTVSIAKAGIITTLNARTSILASANPIGSRYNPNLPVPQNIDLPPTLLSRFDLVYLVLDRVDEQEDRLLAKHLVNMYLEDKPENASSWEVLPIEFLTAYITYAKTKVHPVLTPGAGKALSDAYVNMRKLGDDIRSSDRRITATTRQLESMIRLAEAHARMRLSPEVTADDVEEAVRLIRSAIKQAATDSRTGLIDMGLLTEGTSASERRNKDALKRGVLGLVDDLAGGSGSARWAEVYRVLNDQASTGVDSAQFTEAVRALESEGLVNIKEYYWFYINYEGLKKALKTGYVTEPTPDNTKPDRKPWTEDDERHFVSLLESELDKVFNFQKLKSEEIVRRIQESEKDVDDVVSRLNSANDSRGTGRSSRPPPSDEEFLILEQVLSDIIADVHDLAKFTQLNYTGFQKIIKKHDKQTQWHLKPVFAARLNAKPFFKDNYDAFVVKLSKLYDLVRTKGNPIKGDSAAGGTQQNFVRQTTKYWVHPDNITELKLIILKHLPVLVFNANKEFEEEDSAITSVYYDNPQTWELYQGRLKKTEGAEAIRLRWYGGMGSDQIFVERKTHREDWTGEKSVKARFSLKEKHVNDYLAGRLTVDRIFEKMRKDKKKSEGEIADLEQLAREIQYRVITRRLVPVTRTFYHRTAFQLPGDARVRISLDTELTMIREDNMDGRRRAGSNWRRMDIGVDWPFNRLPPEDVERFPYAVLEVKLQTQAGQEPPQWIRDLTASHLVEAVPKYSKFIHGTATLFPDRIHLLPFWMPQMDVDIRKPATRLFGIQRPLTSTSLSANETPEDDESEDEELDAGQGGRNGRPREASAQSGVSEVGQNALFDDIDGNALDIEERIAAQPLPGDEDYPLYDSDEESIDSGELEEARQVGGWYYYEQLAKYYAQRFKNGAIDVLKALIPRPMPTNMPPPEQSGIMVLGSGRTIKRFVAPKGKRIHVPVRVEPKVYFAAERTFLSWLEFSILLGTIAATLLNFGQDYITFACSWAFTILAALALLYSLVLYIWRVDKIRKRRDVKRVYYEKWGPTVVGIGLVTIMLVNFGLRVRQAGFTSRDGDPAFLPFDRGMIVGNE